MLISLIRPYFRDRGKSKTKDDYLTLKDIYWVFNYASTLKQPYLRDKGMTKEDYLPSKDT